MNYFDSVLRDYVDNGTFKAKELRVLIIDDGNRDYSLQRDLIKLYDIYVETMASDSGYINRVIRERYDLIFVDYSNKKKDFMEVAESIRNIALINESYSDYAKTVPIIVVIGKNAAGNKKVVLGDIVDDFIVKPMDVYYLDRVLRKWVPACKRTKKEEAQIDKKESKQGDKITIEGLDMPYLYKTCGYDKKHLLQKLVVIYHHAMQKAEELAEYINKGDFANYIEQMKFLKLFAKEIGAHSLYEHAKVHQIAGLADNYEFLEERFPNIYENINSIVSNIKMCLRENAKENEGKKLPISEHECKNEMLVALSYIDNIMPNAAVTTLNKLLSCELTTDHASAMISVVDYIEDMEYEKAMRLLKECLVS